MSQYIARNVKVLADQYDVSGFINTGQLPTSNDIHDSSVFGVAVKTSLPGLQQGSFTLGGFTEFGTGKIEKIMSTLKGTQDKPITVVPEGPTVGNVACFLSAAFHGYEFGGPHGNPNMFTWNGGTSKWQVIGGFLEEPGAVARVATGQSAGQQLGAVSASQYLYAAVHVLSGTGTMDLIVESDNSGAFSTPVTVITFPQFTGPGSGIMRVAGALTDDYFRFKWTLATSPSFTFVASFGVDS
jgi:hypothetical protein